MMHRKVRFRRSVRSPSGQGGGLSWFGVGLGVMVGVGTGLALQSLAIGIGLVIAFAIVFGLLFDFGTEEDSERTGEIED